MEGKLFVMYLTCLLLLKREDEYERILLETQGKIKDPIIQANLEKLKGCREISLGQEMKAKKHFSDAFKMFRIANSSHGVASCHLAIGMIYYSKNVDKIRIKCRERLEKALSKYRESKHFYGQITCHKLLCSVLKKLHVDSKIQYHH